MRLIGLFVTSLAFASPAFAQTFGPPIPGYCMLSRTGAISASRAGQSLQAQLKQMQVSLNGELAQRRAALDQQRRALEARQSAIAPIEFQRQLAVLNQQAQALEQQQNARFIAAQTRGQQQIDRALNDALSRVITRSACSVVMERDHAYGWNNAMDITAAAAREMDGVLQNVILQ
ncbi:OmpH family outer membrane protein [Sphingomonas sp. 7/4-4]|uniref:OmpH family outer membrane protein n=1 Tax=Sphingomonas sp. 7/4-4 TaxID=3018446 RepID=UPI0022F3FF6A|nr:OmpH family outer membrane protein [Sphingomonas sp. 7/4-4]WBY07031.1 OmpH family outer membrane protein [Sphingomonas sp. 7/4-4]